MFSASEKKDECPVLDVYTKPHYEPFDPYDAMAESTYERLYAYSDHVDRKIASAARRVGQEAKKGAAFLYDAGKWWFHKIDAVAYDDHLSRYIELLEKDPKGILKKTSRDLLSRSLGSAGKILGTLDLVSSVVDDYEFDAALKEIKKIKETVDALHKEGKWSELADGMKELNQKLTDIKVTVSDTNPAEKIKQLEQLIESKSARDEAVLSAMSSGRSEDLKKIEGALSGLPELLKDLKKEHEENLRTKLKTEEQARIEEKIAQIQTYVDIAEKISGLAGAVAGALGYEKADGVLSHFIPQVIMWAGSVARLYVTGCADVTAGLTFLQSSQAIIRMLTTSSREPTDPIYEVYTRLSQQLSGMTENIQKMLEPLYRGQEILMAQNKLIIDLMTGVSIDLKELRLAEQDHYAKMTTWLESIYSTEVLKEYWHASSLLDFEPSLSPDRFRLLHESIIISPAHYMLGSGLTASVVDLNDPVTLMKIFDNADSSLETLRHGLILGLVGKKFLGDSRRIVNTALWYDMVIHYLDLTRRAMYSSSLTLDDIASYKAGLIRLEHYGEDMSGAIVMLRKDEEALTAFFKEYESKLQRFFEKLLEFLQKATQTELSATHHVALLDDDRELRAAKKTLDDLPDTYQLTTAPSSKSTYIIRPDCGSCASLEGDDLLSCRFNKKHREIVEGFKKKLDKKIQMIADAEKLFAALQEKTFFRPDFFFSNGVTHIHLLDKYTFPTDVLAKHDKRGMSLPPMDVMFEKFFNPNQLRDIKRAVLLGLGKIEIIYSTHKDFSFTVKFIAAPHYAKFLQSKTGSSSITLFDLPSLDLDPPDSKTWRSCKVLLPHVRTTSQAFNSYYNPLRGYYVDPDISINQSYQRILCYWQTPWSAKNLKELGEQKKIIEQRKIREQQYIKALRDASWDVLLERRERLAQQAVTGMQNDPLSDLGKAANDLLIMSAFGKAYAHRVFNLTDLPWFNPYAFLQLPFSKSMRKDFIQDFMTESSSNISSIRQALMDVMKNQTADSKTPYDSVMVFLAERRRQLQDMADKKEKGDDEGDVIDLDEAMPEVTTKGSGSFMFPGAAAEEIDYVPTSAASRIEPPFSFLWKSAGWIISSMMHLLSSPIEKEHALHSSLKFLGDAPFTESQEKQFGTRPVGPFYTGVRDVVASLDVNISLAVCFAHLFNSCWTWFQSPKKTSHYLSDESFHGAMLYCQNKLRDIEERTKETELTIHRQQRTMGVEVYDYALEQIRYIKQSYETALEDFSDLKYKGKAKAGEMSELQKDLDYLFDEAFRDAHKEVSYFSEHRDEDVLFERYHAICSSAGLSSCQSSLFYHSDRGLPLATVDSVEKLSCRV